MKKFEESELADAGEAFARNKRTTLKPMERELWKEQLGQKVKELKRKMFEKKQLEQSYKTLHNFWDTLVFFKSLILSQCDNHPDHR